MTKAVAAKKTSAAKSTGPAARKVASKAVAKPASKAAPAKAAKTVKAVKAPAPKAAVPKAAADKPKKSKLVRDSFTMPENEYALIGKVKKACVGAGFEIKKSELLRIGIALLAQLDLKKLQAAQQALTPLKTGRPKKK